MLTSIVSHAVVVGRKKGGEERSRSFAPLIAKVIRLRKAMHCWDLQRWKKGRKKRGGEKGGRYQSRRDVSLLSYLLPAGAKKKKRGAGARTDSRAMVPGGVPGKKKKRGKREESVGSCRNPETRHLSGTDADRKEKKKRGRKGGKDRA